MVITGVTATTTTTTAAAKAKNSHREKVPTCVVSN